MTRDRRLLSVCLVAVALVAAGFSVSPALAEEVWVAPTHFTTPGLGIFPWPTTGRGFVVLGFAVPDDFESFDSATVVVVPIGSVNQTYDVYGNVRRHGESATTGTVSNLSVPAVLTAGVVEDVDISALLAGQLDATSAGKDYVSVFFWFPVAPGLDRATILGMRFTYNAKPIASADLAAGAVTAAKIANGAVDVTKLGPNSVDSSKVVNDSLTASDLGPGSVGASELAANSVTSIDIVDGSVTTVDIADGTITGADIASNSIGAGDLADEAGADWVSGFQNLELSGLVETVRSVTVTAPAAGFVVVNASASLQFNGVAGSVRCSLSNGSGLDFNHLITETGGAGASSESIAATRGFVVGSGDTTFHLVCQEFGGDIDLLHSSVTAIYVPTRR